MIPLNQFMSDYNRTAFHVDVSLEKTRMLKWLLQRKHININSNNNEFGYTALHKSLFCANIDTVVTSLQS